LENDDMRTKGRGLRRGVADPGLRRVPGWGEEEIRNHKKVYRSNRTHSLFFDSAFTVRISRDLSP